MHPAVAVASFLFTSRSDEYEARRSLTSKIAQQRDDCTLPPTFTKNVKVGHPPAYVCFLIAGRLLSWSSLKVLALAIRLRKTKSLCAGYWARLRGDVLANEQSNDNQ